MSSRDAAMAYDSRSPSTTAPTKVIGKLRNRPNMAAAYALTMTTVSAMWFIVAIGAMRMPASAAREQPIAHASAAERSGRAPWRRASGRLSTEARMSSPVRVR
jgi:hypothetical protein